LVAVATKVLIKATPSAEPSCWKTLLSAPGRTRAQAVA
jgi:hypothetical protein